MAEAPKPQGGNDKPEDDLELDDLTPEQIAAAQRDKKLAEENALARRKNKQLTSEIASMKGDLDSFKALGTPEEIKELLAKAKELVEKGTPPPAVPKTADDPMVAALKKEIADIKKERDEERVKAKAEREQAAADLKAKEHRAAVTALVSEAKLLDPTSAIELLMLKTVWDGQTGLTASMKDEDGDLQQVSVSNEILKKSSLLPNIYWPADGVPGAGTRPPGRGASGGGIDLEKALTGKQSDFEKNRDVIREELKRQTAGGA